MQVVEERPPSMLANTFISQRCGSFMCTAYGTCPLAMLCPRAMQGEKEMEWAKLMPESSLAVYCINSIVPVLGTLPDT